MIRHRSSPRVLGALFAAAIGLSGACTEDTPGSAFDLSGLVASETEEGGATTPLGGALVRFTSDTGQVHEATTTSEGRYEMQIFTDSPFGQVRAEASGFGPSERTVLFDRPQRRVDLVLRPVAP